MVIKKVGACRTRLGTRGFSTSVGDPSRKKKSGKEASRVEKKGNRRGCPEAWHGRRMMARRGFGGRAERGGRMQGAINSEIALALGSYSTPIEARYRGEGRAVTIADSRSPFCTCDSVQRCDTRWMLVVRNSFIRLSNVRSPVRSCAIRRFENR